MIDFIQIPTRGTRTFGWIQEASIIDSLYNVVSVFAPDSDFHKKLVNEIIPSLVQEKDGKNEMLTTLNTKPLSIKYKLLIGTAFTPRSESRCNGIIQAAIKGQKRPFIVDWAADSYVRWAQAINFIKYNYENDSFSITDRGLTLTKATEEDKEKIIIQAILSYPPAYRVLSLLSNPDNPLTKYELGEKLGFTGEEGFVCYPLKSIIAALAETKNPKERSKIRSDWESSSDKYARTICQWFGHLGLVETCKKEISVKYGQKLVSDTLSAFRITPKGERELRNCNGNSRHTKIEKNVSYEMCATKGKDREYLRLRRSLILKLLIENKNIMFLTKIKEALNKQGFDESLETIRDDILGFYNIGINIQISDHKVILTDKIADFYIPIYKNLSFKSELSKEKDEIRLKLKTLSHSYLSLIDLAFDPKQSLLFEIKTMDLFLNECGFYGRHLGGSNKPDGILYTDEDYPTKEGIQNYGIIVDMKAYSKGYNLPIGQQDEMKRYISNNQKRDEKINSTKWWTEFPGSLNNFYFMFVSGNFKGNISEKLNKIYLETNISGTALPIETALIIADRIKSGEITLHDFEKSICNTEYKLKR